MLFKPFPQSGNNRRGEQAGCGEKQNVVHDGTVDAVICCLDGINHLLSREELLECFALVNNYLEDGGVFVFDVNTPHKFKTDYADRDYVLEDDGVMCCWRNRLSKKQDKVDFCLTVFREKNGVWHREDGIESERSYGEKALKNALGECGMEIVDISGGYDFSKPDEDCKRWYITAKKVKNIR